MLHSPPNQYGISQSTPPSGPNVLATTRSLLQSMWDPLIHPPSGPNVLAGTSPRVHPPSGFSFLAGISFGVHPLWSSTSLLAHRPMFGFDAICNGPNPLQAEIVLFSKKLAFQSTKIFLFFLLWDPTLVGEENETLFIRVWKPLPSRHVLKNVERKLEREIPKIVISASGEFRRLLYSTKTLKNPFMFVIHFPMFTIIFCKSICTFFFMDFSTPIVLHFKYKKSLFGVLTYLYL